MKRAFVVLLLAFSAQLSAVGQTPPPASATASAAAEAYARKDWQAAADGYGTIVKANPKDPGAHYRLGVSLLNLGRAAEAAAALERAMEISPNAVFGLALARAHARQKAAEKVFAVFEQMLKLGGTSAEVLRNEPDLDSVRQDPRFAEYSKKLDAIANPCRSRPEYREFDFWIGEWAPQNEQGLTVGTSSIRLILNSCVIFENWETPLAAGKSFSLFDAKTGKWRQTWVDARGNITHYEGGMADGRMVLVAESEAAGKPTLMRMTFSKLPDGNVRQHGESSSDGGRTWTTVYDFKYVRAK